MIMNKGSNILLLLAVWLAFVPRSQSQQAPLKLWYNQPASNWNEALPLGNGRLGAMVFGGPAMERLQLNEETIWAGSPNSNAHHLAKAALPEVRKLIFEGKYSEAQKLADEKIMSQTNDGMPYQTFGDLFITFPGHHDYRDYYRDLNLEEATATTSYSVDGVKYHREILTSFTDQVIIIRLTADQPGQITCIVHMDTPHDESNQT